MSAQKKETNTSQQPRFSYAFFCDDIRYELGNKVTLVGLYGHDLLVQEFPAFIPKLVISIGIETPIKDKLKTLAVKVEMGQDVLVDMHPPSLPDVGSSQVRKNLNLDEPTRATYKFNIPLPPLTVPAPCTLRVIVTLDGVSAIAGKLHISTIEQVN